MPLVALLRGGTDSIIARDSGLKGGRDRALTRLLLNWLVTNRDSAMAYCPANEL